MSALPRPRPKPTSIREAMPGLRRLVPHLRGHMRSQRVLVGGGLTAMFLEVAMRLLEPWPLKFVIDGVIGSLGADIATGAPQDLQQVLALACLGLLAVVGLRAVASYAMTICFALAGNRLLTSVRADAFAHLQRLSLDFHDRARTGDLVQRLTSDVGRLKEVAVTAALPLFGNVVTLAVMLVVVFFLDWQLALCMIVVFPVFLLTGRSVTSRIHTVSRKQRKAEGHLATLATETLGSMPVVQAYTLEEEMQQRFASNNLKTLKDGVKAKKLSAGLERSTDVLVGLATALVLWVGAQRVLAGALTPGELVVFITYLKAAFKPMRDLAKYTGRIAQAAASAERVVDLLEQEPKVRDASWARPGRRLRGHVEFDGVWMGYEPDRPVLHGIDLRIHPGERVAVMGPSGAGKSSLVGLLTRARDPHSGSVRLDGFDLRDLTVHDVRTQVAMILQESLLFATSIRDNIAMGAPGGTDSVTDEQVVAAARVADAHEFITRLPEGYDTVVAERGTTLSGGQRQRIAIARAVIRDAPVVVLDEATTGLDAETEDEVVAALARLTRDRTTLIITHDPEAARGADRLVWLEDGRVVDSGRPGDVLARHAEEIDEGGALHAVG
ncbi:ABC transporter ATP-binding protein [Janibacter corallicola]|uniref:ABC transporter ATP-binding protein n=1 Tax=Janibacter corallicola TaxID=415212 RepID=UPI00082EDE5F|nr:ABC transporter ATP-binding protein [Janibacter corallicola]